MMIRIVAVGLLLAGAAAACILGTAAPGAPAASQPAALEHVSIVDLLARPDAYDGKPVRVEGYLHDKFEDHGLYMTKEHADYLMGKYGVWVSFRQKSVALQPEGKTKTSDFDCKYVLLEGVFNKSGKGHMGLFGGGTAGREPRPGDDALVRRREAGDEALEMNGRFADRHRGGTAPQALTPRGRRVTRWGTHEKGETHVPHS